MKSKTFTLTLKSNVHGFKRGDTLICRETSDALPGKLAILENNICGKWPIPFDDAGPEIENGAVLVGYAVSLSRDLDGEAKS